MPAKSLKRSLNRKKRSLKNKSRSKKLRNQVGGGCPRVCPDVRSGVHEPFLNRWTQRTNPDQYGDVYEETWNQSGCNHCGCEFYNRVVGRRRISSGQW